MESDETQDYALRKTKHFSKDGCPALILCGEVGIFVDQLENDAAMLTSQKVSDWASTFRHDLLVGVAERESRSLRVHRVAQIDADVRKIK